MCTLYNNKKQNFEAEPSAALSLVHLVPEFKMKAFATLIASFPLLTKNSHGCFNSSGTSSTVDPNIIVRNGVLFQIKGCPQAITSAEAEARMRNESLKNGVIILESNGHGRSGNHFVDVSQFLAMGYCCKSKVLELPAKDDKFPTKRGAFKSQNRFFDFSEANNVPPEEYATLAENADICTPEINIGGSKGYNLIGFHPDLKACIERVYLRGCEALYLGDLVDVSKFCGAQDKVSKVETEPVLTNGNASCRNHVLLQEEVVDKEGPAFKILDNSNSGLKAESLVLHMRSGDIFDSQYIKRSKAHGGFGQPPLEYYLKAISSQPWSKVSIITYSDKKGLLNPVFVALKDLATNGHLGPNVTLYQDRSLITDVQEMLCADALAVSRSSLHLLTTAFTRASTIFLPMECGSGNYTRARHENKIAAENSTVLKLERPQTKVYGIEWNTSQGSYSAYVDWSNSKSQREEMLQAGTVRGLQQCCV